MDRNFSLFCAFVKKVSKITLKDRFEFRNDFLWCFKIDALNYKILWCTTTEGDCNKAIKEEQGAFITWSVHTNRKIWILDLCWICFQHFYIRNIISFSISFNRRSIKLFRLFWLQLTTLSSIYLLSGSIFVLTSLNRN